MHRRDRRRGRRLADGRALGARGGGVDQVKVGCIGIGWWSDVLADAMERWGKFPLAACYSRSVEKRQRFATKYGCRAASSYDEVLGDRTIEAIINPTPNGGANETKV